MTEACGEENRVGDAIAQGPNARTGAAAARAGAPAAAFVGQPHGAERADPAGAVRGDDRDPLRGKRRIPICGVRHHRRRHFRRARRPPRSAAEGNLAVRRRTRQPVRLHQLRGRPGRGALFVDDGAVAQPRLGDRAVLRGLLRAAPGPLQHPAHRGTATALAGEFLQRRSGPGRSRALDAADVRQLRMGRLDRALAVSEWGVDHRCRAA